MPVHPARKRFLRQKRRRQQAVRRAKRGLRRRRANASAFSGGAAPETGAVDRTTNNVDYTNRPGTRRTSVRRRRRNPRPVGRNNNPRRRDNRRPQRMSWTRQMRQPFNPLRSPWRTFGDFERSVRHHAQQAYQPQLNDLNTRIDEATSANQARREDIERYYGGLSDRLNQAYADATQALNTLLGTYQSGTQASQQGLANMLSASDQASADRASQLGVAPTPTQTADILNASQNVPGAGASTLAQVFGGMTTAAAREQALAPLWAREAAADEAQRYRNIMEGLQSQRSDLTSRIPAYRQAAREDLYQQALAGQNQGFQQNLARRQFGLSERQFGLARQNQRFQQNLANRQFGLQERQFNLAKRQFGLERMKFEHARNLDWANLNLQKDQIDREYRIALRELRANRNDARARQRVDRAQAKARRFDAAVNGLAQYLAPNRREERRPRLYRRYYEDALRLLMGQYRLDAVTAHKLLGSTTIRSWQARSRRILRGRRAPSGRSNWNDPTP